MYEQVSGRNTNRLTRGEPVEQVVTVAQQAPPAEGIFDALIASAQESGQLGTDELAVAGSEPRGTSSF